jgi:hypothetical protein
MSSRREYRLSTPRRVERFVRFMNKHFPPRRNHGVLWWNCINLQTFEADKQETCALAQVSGTGDFKSAMKKFGFSYADPELQHSAIMLYNLSTRARDRGFHRAEANRLNPVLKARIAHLQRLCRAAA